MKRSVFILVFTIFAAFAAPAQVNVGMTDTASYYPLLRGWRVAVLANQTSVAELPGVFVGGDCQVGPKTVIIAIGAGKVAARNIDDYLGFNHELDCGVEVPPAAANWRQPCGRVNIVERPARERKGDFDAVEVEMSAEEAFQEARRCLRCDHFGCGVLDEGRVQYV